MRFTFLKKSTCFILVFTLMLSCLCMNVNGLSEYDSKNWMSKLDDNIHISEINLPGTHDSATAYVRGLREDSFACCQDKNIKEQLDLGVRFFDIRLCNEEENDKNILYLSHGTYYCYKDIGRKDSLSFDEVLDDWVYPFLENNPSETIVMLVKEESSDTNSTKLFEDTLYGNYLSGDRANSRWYTENKNPVLSDVRGKIVLARRYNYHENKYYDRDHSGIDLSKWGDNKTFEVNMFGGKSKAYIEDEYSWYSIALFSNAKAIESKWRKFNNNVQRADRLLKENVNNVVVSYGSAHATPITSPLRFAEGKHNGCINNYDGINDMLKKCTLERNKNYGWLVMDFIDAELAEKIYKTNF